MIGPIPSAAIACMKLAMAQRDEIVDLRTRLTASEEQRAALRDRSMELVGERDAAEQRARTAAQVRDGVARALEQLRGEIAIAKAGEADAWRAVERAEDRADEWERRKRHVAHQADRLLHERDEAREALRTIAYWGDVPEWARKLARDATGTGER